jgi:Leucine-rich repeat (LRR) protein
MKIQIAVLLVIIIQIVIAVTNVDGQDLIVKARVVKGKPALFSTINIDTYLHNNGSVSVSIFKPDLASQTWMGYQEKWEITSPKGSEKFEYLRGRAIEGAWKKFNLSDFVNLNPGDSVLISTLPYTFRSPGTYSFQYAYEHNKSVRENLGADAAAKAKAASTPSVTLTTQLSFNVKDIPIPDFKPTILFAKDVYTKKEFVTVDEAFANPEDAFRLKLTNIELSDELLEKICKLKNLHALELIDCSKISKLPPAIGALNLVSLLVKLHDYEVKEFFIPAELERLRNLESLYLDVPISSFPESVTTLTALKYLTLRNGTFNAVSGNISNLKNLVTLNLFNLPVTQLPKSIGSLSNLYSLNLEEMPLAELPEEVGNLGELRIILLQKTSIQKLPSSIAKLAKLESLSVLSSNFTVFPTDFLEMKKLISLNFTGNKIDNIPAEIGKAKHLRSIYIAYNLLTDLPLELGEITNIQVVAPGNSGLSKAPNVKKLKKLPNVKLYL